MVVIVLLPIFTVFVSGFGTRLTGEVGAPHEARRNNERSQRERSFIKKKELQYILRHSIIINLRRQQI